MIELQVIGSLYIIVEEIEDILFWLYLQYPKIIVHKNLKQKLYTGVTHGVVDGTTGNIKHSLLYWFTY